MGSVRTGVQLALMLEEKYFNKLPQQVIVQPKLNGERFRVEWQEGEPQFMTSCSNKALFLTNLKKELKRAALHQVNFDGEVYVHGWSREDIHSVCSASRKEPHNMEDHLQFHIFDMVNYNFRMNQLTRIRNVGHSVVETDAIKVVPSTLIDKDDWMDYAQIYLDKGYEGIILRHPDKLYTDGKRVNVMYKYKPTEQEHYTIVGYEEEIDIHGFAKSALGSVLVQDSDGVTFSVGTGKALTRSERIRWWTPEGRATLSSGKCIATVKHSPIKTVNNMPTCTALLEIKIESNVNN